VTKLAAALVALVGSAALGHTARAQTVELSGCNPTSALRTTAIIDGDLYAMVRSQQGRYLFGWSGPPVRSYTDAVRLVRALGVTGSEQQLIRLVTDPKTIAGGEYADLGSIASFSVRCPGTYRLTAVVRTARFLPATRIWLRQERQRVLRSFCMSPQWLPSRARITVTFSSPLAATAPSYTVDRNADGKVDRNGTFRSGGAGFPASPRC
jgi:hypothetical protein